MELDISTVHTDVYTDNISDIYELVNLSVLTFIVCILGIVSNVINITVFYKHGLKSTVNISFMALSITDLCNVILIEWVSISSLPVFQKSQEVAIFPPEVSYLTGGFPHGCMSRVTAWITVYMTTERCLCIALPFKVKSLITPRRTICVIAGIYVITILPLIPEYEFFYLDWKYFPFFNTTRVGLVVRIENLHLEGVSFLVYAVMMVTSFPAIIFLTLVLIVQLNTMSQWRINTQLKGNQSDSLSQKDKMAIRTVLVIACVLILTFMPTFIFCAVCFIVPGFGINGQYRDRYTIFVSFAFLFDAINASINFILYYIINSSYRRTLHETFYGQKKGVRR